MLFTGTAPTRQDAPVRLFFSYEEVQADTGAGRPIYAVAVHFDGLLGRLLPLEPGRIEPAWTAPAQYTDAGYVVAPAPLPQPLFRR